MHSENTRMSLHVVVNRHSYSERRSVTMIFNVEVESQIKPQENRHGNKPGDSRAVYSHWICGSIAAKSIFWSTHTNWQCNVYLTIISSPPFKLTHLDYPKPKCIADVGINEWFFTCYPGHVCEQFEVQSTLLYLKNTCLSLSHKWWFTAMHPQLFRGMLSQIQLKIPFFLTIRYQTYFLNLTPGYASL